MNGIDRMIALVSPQRALKRVRARAALMHYDAATVGRRGAAWVASGSDADAAARKRDRLAYISRDMVRNTPFAARAQQVIANNVVGDGIIPKIEADDKDLRKEGLRLIEEHLDTTAIDADGRQNLYGLQRLAMNTIVDSGEVLILREQTVPRPGRIGLQLRLLEPDFLDTSRDGMLPDGNLIREGIEYDRDGRRVAYHLFDQHPGSDWFRGVGWRSRSSRVEAARVLHIYRQDRPGQMRGVSWFASIALSLQDLGDYQDAQIMRQKIAACFAGFRKVGNTMSPGKEPEPLGTLSPGLIQDIGEDEDMIFADPPDVGGQDVFTRTVLMSVAAGMGITYEALTGDMSNVNFSSGRMGRMEMDRNISGWQWTMVIPQMLQPLGRWLIEEWALAHPERARLISNARLMWVPPHRILVDPTREIPALKEAVRAGFASRQGVVRQLGADPERLHEEICADRASALSANLTFDSDASAVSGAGVAQKPDAERDGEENGAENGK